MIALLCGFICLMPSPLTPDSQHLVQVAAPAFANLNTTSSRTVQINTAPRAGQAWRIDNILFNYPNATSPDPQGAISSVPRLGFLTVKAFVDGVEIGKQEIQVQGENPVKGSEIGKPSNEPIRGYIGTIEPIRPAVAYNSLALEFVHSSEEMTIDTHVGFILITYTLLRRHGR